MLSDPWDLVSINGSGPFFADVISVGRDKTGATALLLAVEPPIRENNLKFKYFVASPRHEGVALEETLSGGVVSSNLTGIPADKAKGSDPFDLSWWRGGIAATGDLSIE